jgi:hypothetical protein
MPRREVGPDWADGIARLDPKAEDKRQACGTLLGLLADETSGPGLDRLTSILVLLHPTAQDGRQACGALLGRLADQTTGWRAADLAVCLAQLDPTA